MRWAWLSCALAIVVAPSCHRLGTFACDDDTDCVDGSKRGSCEAGFCAYPDDDCEAPGLRYDDLAGNGLAGECVVADANTTDASTDPSTTVESESGDATSDPARTCADADGDGFGEGEGCDGPDCDDDNPNTNDGCRYIAPDGVDAGDGTRDAPWLTFGHALAQLRPGDSLVLLDGDYEPATNGAFDFICDEADPDHAPIFVRAESERRAHLKTGGTAVGLAIANCSHWRFRGLRISGGDAQNEGIDTIILRDSTDVELRRLLVHDGNRFRRSVVVWTPGSSHVLFEEWEVYAFSHVGLYVGGDGVVARRVYINGRGYADLPDCSSAPTPEQPECSVDGDGANVGIHMTGGGLIENVVVENADTGIGGGGVVGATILGSVVSDGVHGIVFGTNDGPAYSTDIRIEHTIALRFDYHAIYLRSVGNATLRNNTAILADSFHSDLDGTTPCPDGGCFVDGVNLLGIAAPETGMMFYGGPTGVVRYSNSVGGLDTDYYPPPTDDPIEDDAGIWQRSMAIPAGRIGIADDECIAFIPADSPMKGAGEHGDDIGANIRDRYEDGLLTGVPLWDAETGAFPCGAVIEGVNDDADTSCIGLHTRLHVNTPGCPLPDGS